jgi:light-regulated signal transduction histidine kinase (bacteriophytochrome)
VTERKKLEEQLKHRADELAIVNKELESFSFSISHDLRSPLQIMRTFSTILIADYSDRLDAEGLGFLNRIVKSADKMNDLIDDILGLAKVSRQQMDWQQIDLSVIAQTTFDELRQTEPDRDIKFYLPGVVNAYADPRLMSIALSNLIGNAWKYSSKTAVSRIEFGYFEKNGKSVYYVHDNGAGFDMKLSHKLFVPFERLHSDSQFTGTGIGLPIVEKVIQRHKGRIWAEGEIGKGATFFFTLSDDEES